MPSNAFTKSRIRWQAAFGATLIFSLLIVPAVCMAQSPSQNDKAPPTECERATKPASDAPPPGSSERAELLQIIRNLQERVARLESQVSGPGPTNAPDAKPPQATAVASGVPSESINKRTEPESSPSKAAKASGQADEPKELGTYTPNLGFKLANTEYGDLSLSIYTYVRYLNQKGLDP